MKKKKRRTIMRKLIKTVDTYRVNDEEEAVQLIEEFKNNQLTENYTLNKSGYVLKNKKSKGEIIDSWAIVTLERVFE
jgi:hypothetical protein